MIKKSPNRREFLKESVLYSSALFLGCKKTDNPSLLKYSPNRTGKSKIVIANDNEVRDNDGRLSSDKVLKILNKAIKNLTNSDDPKTAWQKLISPDDRVSLKVNCLAGKGMSTSKEIVEAVIYNLLEIGVKKENIIVWDRLNNDFERAGYSIITDKNQVRYMGNDYIGYTDDFYFHGEVGSLLSKIITDFSTVIINIPILKDHGIVGLSAGMKNMFGAIHNPNKYHLNIGNPYVADVNAIPAIKERLRLTICDAFTMQYEGGPPYKPQYTFDYNSILVSTDPVALDFIGWKLIEEKRKENNIITLKEAGREPGYIFIAADEYHKLGYAKEEMIEVVRC